MVSPSSWSLAALLLSQAARVTTQLALPAQPFLPPSPDFGARPSTGSSLPNKHWSTLLGNGLFFYEAQRSGKLPNTNRVSWRNDSCINDGQDVNLDLSGGYYDAGDFIKATFPLSFSIMQICWGAIDHGRGYDLSNQTAYLDDMLRWSLGWLIKAHPSPNTLFVQIDTGDPNSVYWGGDRGIPQDRPSYQINDNYPGTDAAAMAAAAFASCSSLYAGRSFTPYSPPASLQDTSYASILLQHAQQLYSFAVNALGGQMTYQTAVPIIVNSYPSSGYGDDLAIAALWLGLAQNNSTLISQAQGYYDKFKLNTQLEDSVFNWDSVLPGIPILATQIHQSDPQLGGDGWQSRAEVYLDRVVSGKGSGNLTKGGLLYYDQASQLDSLNPALNAAMLLRRYATIATSNDKRDTYLQFSKGQIDYFLGKNPMSMPYVVGIHPNSPRNPHSAMASGGNNISDINNSPPVMAHTLYGAVVGGPDWQDKYYDIRDDWAQSEVALDYNAPLLTLAAMHVMNDTADPFYTSLGGGAAEPSAPPSDPAHNHAPSLSTEVKIAIAVAATVVGLATLGAIVFVVVRRRRGKGPLSPAQGKIPLGRFFCPAFATSSM